MSIFEMFKNFNKDKAELPSFKKSEIIRRHYIFIGRVQAVGFRYTLFDISNRLNLTGWVKNLTDGSVEAEIQGEKDRIDYAIKYMGNRPFINIEKIDFKDIELIKGEEEFVIGN